MSNFSNNIKPAQVFKGHIVSPLGPDKLLDIQDGYLLCNQDGAIEAVLTSSEFDKLNTSGKALPKVIDLGKRLIMPGFVDTHVHLPQISLTGKSGASLLDWLNTFIFPVEAKFQDVDYSKRIARWFFSELARNGTTSSLVFTTIHPQATDIAFQVAAEIGSRAIIGKVMMDSNAPEYLIEDTGASIEQSASLCKKWHGYDNGRLLYAFTPRFAVACSAELLAGAGSAHKDHPGSYVHTHLSETKEEIAFVSKNFPENTNYFNTYESFGLAGSHSVFAHAIHLSDQEISAIEGSSSCLAHCPSSNFFLKSGVFQYERISRSNIKFGLGSDVGAGPEFCLFQVMKDANYIQPEYWISPIELFFNATLGGAKALSLESKTGSLEVGKEADFIVIDPSFKSSLPADLLEHKTADILSSLIYLGDDRVIAATFTRGKALYINEKIEELFKLMP
jgi:guanine deaminase